MSGAEAAPPALAGAISRALKDLKAASGTSAQISLMPAEDEALWRIDAAFEDGTEFGFEVALDADIDVCVAVADGLQAAFIENTQTAVPRCPEHQHPLSPRTEAGRCGWFCPADRTLRADIGSYLPGAKRL